MRPQKVYLRDILERIHRIEEIAQIRQQEFNRSHIFQDAIIRDFEVIGEIVKRLAPELISTQPTIQWKRIAGFRDVLIHDYERVDLDLVWRFIENDLPSLKQAVEAMLEDWHDPDDLTG